MSTAKWTWALLGALYALFFGWYTSWGGPLTQEEVEHYIGLIKQRDGSPERLAILREFLESDSGDDFLMWNIIDMHETPLAIEGVEPGQSSDDVLARYMEYMFPAMLRRASHPVILGASASPAPEMFGIEGARDWTRGAGVRYRSRRDLMEIAANPAFGGSHAFKIAAIEKTIAFPVDPWFYAGDPRLLLALIFLVIGFGVSWWGAARTRR